MVMTDYSQLKQRHRAERHAYSIALSTRVHRALSWLNKSESCEDDDAKFTFLWIAFNSAYAQDFDYRYNLSERYLHKEFFSKLVEIDKKAQLYNIVWRNYSNTIRITLNNEYILQPFWEFHSGRITDNKWKKIRQSENTAANDALSDNDTALILSIVFNRLYTLRNQIIHGGATYGSSVNRKQLRDCTMLLEQIVPVIIDLMMDGKCEVWGDPVYPVINF